MPNKNAFTYIITLCLLLLGMVASAQKTVVIGSAPAFKNSRFLLYTPADFVNGSDEVIDTLRIDAGGSFSITINTNQTLYTFLRQGDLMYDLYIEPNQALTVTIPDTAGFAIDSILQPVIFGGGPTALNNLIATFDTDYNNFVLQNYKLFLRKTGQKATKDFIAAQDVKYAGNTNAYFAAYRLYRIASLELLAQVKSRKEVLDTYFRNKPILYKHPAYMALFNELYEKNLKVFRTAGRDGEALTLAINNRADYPGAMLLLQADSTIPNDTLRELALIKGLGEMYYEPTAVQSKVLEMLRYIKGSGLGAGNRLIAGNTLAALEKLRPGSPAPVFTLRNIVSGQQVSLADFKGKPVYISFWDEDNPRAVQEIDLILELDKKYGRKITFISICNCANDAKTLAFINRNKYKWVFLNSKGNSKVLDEYEVLSYPAFYLIDSYGNILRSPADRPSGNIERTLESLSKTSK